MFFRFLSSTVRVTCVRAIFSLLALLVAIAGPALLLAFQVVDGDDYHDHYDDGGVDDDDDHGNPRTSRCHCWPGPSSCLSGSWSGMLMREIMMGLMVRSMIRYVIPSCLQILASEQEDASLTTELWFGVEVSTTNPRNHHNTLYHTIPYGI